MVYARNEVSAYISLNSLGQHLITCILARCLLGREFLSSYYEELAECLYHGKVLFLGLREIVHESFSYPSE